MFLSVEQASMKKVRVVRAAMPDDENAVAVPHVEKPVMSITTRNRTPRVRYPQLTLVILCLLMGSGMTSAADGERHVLAADYSKKRIALIGPDGRTLWENKIGSIHDLHVLPDGNILFQRNMQHLVEVNDQILGSIEPLSFGR